MNKKIQAILLLVIVFGFSLHAQTEKKTAILKGRLINKATKQPANDVQVTIPYLKMLTNTDGEGNFSFSQVAYGTQNIVIGGTTIKGDTIRVLVAKDVADLGDIMVASNDANTSVQSLQIPTIALEDNSSQEDDESSKSQSVSGLLSASRDPFQNTLAFVLGTYRFLPRGYDRNQQQVLINGAVMNDVETGDAYWSQWGGLNDAFRSRDNTYGLQASEYAFGGLNGTTYFDATAVSQRKQTRITYSTSNRQYRNRLMLTKSSGLMKSGWAYSVSLSKRWANSGYIDGTFYDAYSYYAAISKRIKKHTFSLTAFAAPTERGKSAPTYREATELLGDNFYNPNWGYQNGQKRNSKVARSNQPIFLFNYDYSPSDKFHWNTVIGYQFGKNENSGLDWYNAPDPRPDYYGYLPSYYTYAIPTNTNGGAEANKERFLANHQVDWNNLYNTNYLNRIAIPNADGTPGLDSARRSVYVLGNDVDDIKKFNFNTTLQSVLNQHTKVFTGVSFISQQTESYRQLSDLLGGDFFLNVNSFTERSFLGDNTINQNDVNHPNQILKTGDKYYYDYIVRFQKAWWWGQAAFTFNKVDFFIAANIGVNSFQREGLYKNGLYATGNESYGKGEKQSFLIYGLKGGLTYKINGRNYLFINAATTADAPTVDNTCFSSRIRNAVVDNPITQKSYSVEGGYLLHSPKMNARIVGYVTDMNDGVDIQRFYYTGSGSANTFIDYILQNVDTRFIGTELALNYKLTSSVDVTGVVALGQAFYTARPKVTGHFENASDSVQIKDVTYLNNYYLGVGPQSAYSLGVNYRSKSYWYVNLNGSLFDRNYIDPAAARRTTQTVDLVTPGSDQWNSILGQEKLPAAFALDISGGKSFLLSKFSKKIPRSTFLYLNAGISNLLDNKDLRTGGFENLRYDFTGGAAGRYASKYFYAYGRSFFVNLSLKF